MADSNDLFLLWHSRALRTVPSAFTAVRIEKFEVWSVSRGLFSAQPELKQYHCYKSYLMSHRLYCPENVHVVDISDLGYIYVLRLWIDGHQIKKCNWSTVRKYWMIYRGPGPLAVVCFDSLPPRQLARPATHKKTEKERQLAHGIREGGNG